MDVRKMAIEFERRVQLISPDLVVDNKLKSDDILSFLNFGQDRYVKIFYSQNDEVDGDTRNHKRNMDSIKSLLVQKMLTNFDVTVSNQRRFSLPTGTNEEYFLYEDSTSLVNGTYLGNASNARLQNTLIKPNQLDLYNTTADNRPIITKPGVVIMSDPQTKLNYLVVAHDEYTSVSRVILTYYRRPLRMAFTASSDTVSICELPESSHNEIVDLAVDMFITETKYKLNSKPS